MSYIWIKIVSGLLFVLVPGFSLKENLKSHPYLTFISMLLGLFLLYLSIAPLVDEKRQLENFEIQFTKMKDKEVKDKIANIEAEKKRKKLQEEKADRKSEEERLFNIMLEQGRLDREDL